MDITITCPSCNKDFTVNHATLSERIEELKCCFCGDAPAPDIMTAYANVGKSITQLYGCCSCGPTDKSWLPKDITRK